MACSEGRLAGRRLRPRTHERMLVAVSEGLDREIATQQAAYLLRLSRSTVVRLIEEGELPAHATGSGRRQLRLTDVLRYREKLRTRRESLIDDFTEQYGEEDPKQLAALIAEARRAR